MQTIVIFDMDGTLVDSKKDITVSINYVRALNHQLPPLEEEFVVESINKDVRNLPKLFYNTPSYEKRDRVAFEKHYKTQCTQNPYLYEGIFETLQALRKEGVKLSVATNAPTVFAQEILGSLGVLDMFEMIIGADKVNVSKPNPEMLLKILEFYSYDASRDRAWMIGDNSKDMQSAEGAEIKSAFATWGFTPQAEYKRILKEPKEILELFMIE